LPRKKPGKRSAKGSATPRSGDVTTYRHDPKRKHLRPTDYDGRTFCITQAFFPDRGAWEKLARALKDSVDEERFAALSGTESLPFEPGEHARVAVKVIDPRGAGTPAGRQVRGQMIRQSGQARMPSPIQETSVPV
jgi:hypothetical protein